MTKREQYGLTFSKWTNPADGSITPICQREIINNFSELQFIDDLEVSEINGLLNLIDKAQNGVPHQDSFITDSIDDMDEIRILPPNISINSVCVIPLQDMKELLLEWLDFIQS